MNCEWPGQTFRVSNGSRGSRGARRRPQQREGGSTYGYKSGCGCEAPPSRARGASVRSACPPPHLRPRGRGPARSLVRGRRRGRAVRPVTDIFEVSTAQSERIATRTAEGRHERRGRQQVAQLSRPDRERRATREQATYGTLAQCAVLLNLGATGVHLLLDRLDVLDLLCALGRIVVGCRRGSRVSRDCVKGLRGAMARARAVRGCRGRQGALPGEARTDRERSKRVLPQRGRW